MIFWIAKLRRPAGLPGGFFDAGWDGSDRNEKTIDILGERGYNKLRSREYPEKMCA